jgi:hypothetical protein
VQVQFVVENPQTVLGAVRAAAVEDVVSVDQTRPYEEMPDVLSRADVGVIVEAPVEEGIFLPSKFVEYVQAGLPILALSPPVGTISEILAKHGGGIAVDGRSSDAVAGAIQRLYEHWKCGTLDRSFGSSRLLGLFGEETILSMYQELFRKLATHGSPQEHTEGLAEQ